MEFPSIVTGFILLAVALGFVIQPFQRKQRKSTKAISAQVKPAKRREAVLSAIRDLDFDYKTGKVSEEDYTPLRAQLLLEAAQAIEASRVEEDKLESMIQARRASQQKNKCDQCGATLEPGQHFCAKCGTAICHESCPQCGKRIHPGDLFCTSCGSGLEVGTAKSQCPSGEPSRVVPEGGSVEAVAQS